MNREELRLHLESLELPQRRFAVMMGVSYSTVKRWLTGEAPIPMTVVILLRLVDCGVLTTQWIQRAHRPIKR